MNHTLKEIMMAIWHFSIEMFMKMQSKFNEGFSGWNEIKYKENIIRDFEKKSKQILSGDLSQCVDAANYLMMLNRFYMQNDGAHLTLEQKNECCEWVLNKNTERYETTCGYEVPLLFISLIDEPPFCLHCSKSIKYK